MDLKPDVRPETIKLQEENIGCELLDINPGNYFLDLTPKAREIKPNVNTWNYVTLKSFYTMKNATNKVKRQASGW